MAAYGSLQHIFDNPLPENPTLLESLSPWNQIKSVKKPVDPPPSLTEIFREFYFKENPPPPPSHSYRDCHKRSESLSVMNSESLQLCTEGLGVESSDDVVEDLREEQRNPEERLNVKCPKKMETKHSLCGEFRRSRTSGGGTFPPPISCLGESGKPWFCFKPHRKDGRLVLREVRVPSRVFLHSCREDGRLKMHFVHPNDEILEEEDDEGLEDMEELDGDEGSIEGNPQ